MAFSVNIFFVLNSVNRKLNMYVIKLKMYWKILSIISKEMYDRK